VSDEDKQTFKLIAIITISGVFILITLVLIGAFYAEYECIQIVLRKEATMDSCYTGAIGKTFLEFAGVLIGILVAVKVFMGTM
jgi:hypothetical protein